jgi:phage shock protein PspC (stress-responsive transcriptional regulator)
MLDGVCGGGAKYFNLDPTLVRIAWVLLALLGGSGILLYIVAMIVMPKEPYIFPNSSSTEPTPSSKKNSLFWGILLIAVGIFLFLDNIGFPFWRHWWWFDGGFVLSVLLILAGVAFLWGGRNSFSRASQPAEFQAADAGSPSTEAAQPAARRLYRSFSDSKLFGVCGGLGEYFGIDSTIIRILFIVGAFASGGIFVLGYIIMAIVLPKEIPSFKTS